ncbi:cell wall elongation regulator TseB-like domain-containing protein [Dolosigranulum pigrum]
MKKLLIGINFVLTAIIIFMILMFNNTAGPYYHAKVEATNFARKHANLVEQEDFYWYSDSEGSYLTVTGQNGDQASIIVLIRQSDGAIMVLDQAETVSQEAITAQMIEDIAPAQILNYRMGIIEQNIPIWEVTYKKSNGSLGYYIASLENGAWLRTIDGL